MKKTCFFGNFAFFTLKIQQDDFHFEGTAGDNEIKIKPGEKIVIEAKKLNYKSNSSHWGSQGLYKLPISRIAFIGDCNSFKYFLVLITKLIHRLPYLIFLVNALKLQFIHAFTIYQLIITIYFTYRVLNLLTITKYLKFSFYTSYFLYIF